MSVVSANPCPTRRDLADYLMGRLEAEDPQRISEHVQTCAACTTRLAELTQSENPAGPPPTALESEPHSFSQQAFSPWSGPPTDAANLPQPSGANQQERFRLCEIIGRGGTADVYRAFDPVTHREIALKLPHLHILASDRRRRRFLREAHALAKLHHPAIVPVYEAGDDNTQCYLASEFCPGGSLANLLRERQTPIESRDAARIMAQLADAVQHSHRMGILHRDIKPGNILLTKSNPTDRELVDSVKLADFGLAGFSEASGHTTNDGAVMGTYPYMAPEQIDARNQKVGEYTDVWALGVVLYELLTLRTPFQGASTAQTIDRVCNDAPSIQPLARAAVPNDLQAICLNCLEKQPDRRYASAADLRDDLRRFLDGRPTIARPLSRLERLSRWADRNRATAALLSITILALTAAAVVSAISAGQARRHAVDLGTALSNAQKAEHAAQIASHSAMEARNLAEDRLLSARRSAYLSDMRFAFEQYASGLLVDARTLVDAQIPDAELPDTRGFEWSLLNAQLDSRMKLIGRHDGQVSDFDFFPGKTEIATVGDDGAIRIWDIGAREMLRAFPLQDSPLFAVGVSPDGEWIAYSPGSRLDGLEKVVAVMDARDGREFGVLNVHDTTVREIRFSEDGRFLASGSIGEKACIWKFGDGLSGQSLDLFESNKMFLALNGGLQYSRSGKEVMTVGADFSSCVVWDCESGRVLETYSNPDGRRIRGFAWSEATGYLALLIRRADGHHLKLLDLATGAVVSRMPPERSRDNLTCLVFSADGDVLFAGGEAGRIHVIELDRRRSDTDGKSVKLTVRESPQVHFGEVLRIRPLDPQRVISTGVDGRIVMLESLRESPPPFNRSDSARITQFAASPGGDLLAACDTRSRLSIVNREHGTVHARHELAAQVCAIAWSGDGTHVAALGIGGELWCFRVEGEQLISVLNEQQDEPPPSREGRIGLALNKEGSRLFAMSTSEPPGVDVFDVARQQRIAFLPTEFGVSSIVLSPDESVIVAGYKGGFATWHAETLEPMAVVPIGGHVSAMAVTPDRQSLVVGTADGVVRLWSLSAPTLTRVLQEYNRTNGAVSVLRFSNDGRSLLVGDSDGKLRFWNTATWDYCGSIQFFSGTNSRVAAFAEASNGRSLDLLVGKWVDRRRMVRLPIAPGSRAASHSPSPPANWNE